MVYQAGGQLVVHKDGGQLRAYQDGGQCDQWVFYQLVAYQDGGPFVAFQAGASVTSGWFTSVPSWWLTRLVASVTSE